MLVPLSFLCLDLMLKLTSRLEELESSGPTQNVFHLLTKPRILNISSIQRGFVEVSQLYPSWCQMAPEAEEPKCCKEKLFQTRFLAQGRTPMTRHCHLIPQAALLSRRQQMLYLKGFPLGIWKGSSIRVNLTGSSGSHLHPSSVPNLLEY